jgi:ketosteroid isomerase-like protein
MMTSVGEAATEASTRNDPLREIREAMNDVDAGWNTADTQRILARTAADVTFQRVETQPDGSRQVVFARGQGEMGALIDRVKGPRHDFSMERARMLDGESALVDQRIVLTGIKTPQGELPPITVYATTLWVKRRGRWVGLDIRVY